ncbi:Aste57867_15074 [Aphanomyces stellatus]|uniref:Aste57867_15074 protein n=2 Tax=Aphanomyces stellatus TaxID=120398 RepID=A0A485L2B6_9STRA|nr:hypothetical protein As57867_015018 [Aphanomyces stellatus]VFT91887.1 Aste57867_15074 [Aphanomyces stellatus]
MAETRPPRGLTLGFFKHFVALHGGRDAFLGLTTEDVCTRYVLPFTASTKASMVDHILATTANPINNEDEEGTDKTTCPYVQPASWFVSHAWSYVFLDVIDALDGFFAEQVNDSDSSGDNVAVWFCLFNNNQHDVTDKLRRFDYWVDSFQSALTAIGQVVMVLSPWQNPTTLTRTWCVFEIYVAYTTHARFEIAMGHAQKQVFLQDIQDDHSFEAMLGTIKSEASQTAVASDRDNIIGTMTDANVSFADLDRMVLEVLSDWIVHTVQRHIDRAVEAVEKAQWLDVMAGIWVGKRRLEDANHCISQALAIYRDERYDVHSGKWKTVARAAGIAGELGAPRSDWEPMFQIALTKSPSWTTNTSRH